MTRVAWALVVLGTSSTGAGCQTRGRTGGGDDSGGGGDSDGDADGESDADVDGDGDGDGDGDADADGDADGVERCNGADDDGDGLIDRNAEGEPLTRDCETECGPGEAICQEAEWICYAPPVRDEQCDGFDNDCDAEVDEGCECLPGETRSCGPEDVGACRSGREACDTGGQWGACTGAVGPDLETCANRIDDDCDGETDESCECDPGDQQACGTDVGACRAGLQTCSDEGTWGGCAGAIEPVAEACNAVDDDCDGATDETWGEDDLEPNDECDGPFQSEIVGQDAAPLVLPALTLHSADDEDWFTLRAEEAFNVCVPGSDQCSFQLTVQVAPDEALGSDGFELCIIDGACAACGGSGDWDPGLGAVVLELVWDGVCGLDDSRDLHVVVRATGDSCGAYTASFAFARVAVACPGA